MLCSFLVKFYKNYVQARAYSSLTQLRPCKIILSSPFGDHNGPLRIVWQIRCFFRHLVIFLISLKYMLQTVVYIQTRYTHHIFRLNGAKHTGFKMYTYLNLSLKRPLLETGVFATSSQVDRWKNENAQIVAVCCSVHLCRFSQ